MTDRYTLDANILFYAADANAGYKHTLARDVVRQAPRGNCLITLQALGEVYNAISRRKSQYRDAAEELLVSLGESVQIVPASLEDVFHAVEQHRQRPLQFWDTLLWATARRYRCTTILTEDAQDRPLVGGVRYTNPFTAALDELSPFLP